MTGKQLRALRKRLSLSRTQLADKLHVTQDAITKWENGKRAMRGPVVELVRQLTKDKM